MSAMRCFLIEARTIEQWPLVLLVVLVPPIVLGLLRNQVDWWLTIW